MSHSTSNRTTIRNSQNPVEIYMGIIHVEANKFPVNGSFTREDAVQELILKTLELIPSLENVSSPFGLVKKALHDYRVDCIRKMEFRSDTSVYNKPTEEHSLDDMLVAGSSEWDARRDATPLNASFYSDLVDRIKSFTESEPDFYEFALNVISPSQAIIEKYEEIVKDGNKMNRKAIPPMTIGRLLGMTERQMYCYILRLREFATSLGYSIA